LPGLRALVRKDVGEWTHGTRAVTVVIVTGLFMTLAAANSWIQAWVVANVPEAGEAAARGGAPHISLVPFDNILAGVGSQIFLIAAIFAAMSLIVLERQNGTLAWIASKPVSRSSIWMSKWISATAVLSVAAAIVPMALTVAVATVLYGVPPIGAIVLTTVGMSAAIAFLVAVALAASTLVKSQPGVAGIAFAVMFVPNLLAGIVPFDIAPYLPTSILTWTVGLATGADVGFVTPIAWAVGLAIVTFAATRRMDALEL
jgi:ABC-type transport system involved in multi-copper enzyme maturation permease subunit